jgi:20S proteasome subunit alpha 5
MQELTLQEAETIALSILKQVMEEKVWHDLFILELHRAIHQICDRISRSKQVTPNNVDIAKVAPKYHLYTPAEVEAVIARL